MAVRVRLLIQAASGRSLEAIAVLNGGFEVPEPHLLLPLKCAEALVPDLEATATRREMTAAGGNVQLRALAASVTARVRVPDRDGPTARFRVLVSEADEEVLVSDAGIDALAVRIETFVPGRWRLADETRIRDTEAPQMW
jgi:hypothetical protein